MNKKSIIDIKNDDISDESIKIDIMQSKICPMLPFSITGAGKFIANKDYYIERTGRNDYCLIYTVSGNGELTVDKNRRVLSRNTVVLFDCKKYHKYTTAANLSDKWEFYYLQITGRSCDVYMDFLFQRSYLPINITDNLTLTNLFETTINISQKTDPDIPFYLSDSVCQIMKLLIDTKKSAMKENIRQNEIVQKAISYIKENYSLLIKIEDISEHIGISKYYFMRLFKQTMRVTLYEYLLMFRINEAKKLFQNTDYTSYQISRIVGFNDEFNFSRTFKKITGMSPRNYKGTY